MFMWVGITTPLCFLGAYYGYKKRPIEHPGNFFVSSLFSILKLKNQSAPTQFHDMFPSKCSTRAPFRALSWAVFYPLAVFSFNCFSFSTRFGHIKSTTCLASCCSVSFSFCVFGGRKSVRAYTGSEGLSYYVYKFILVRVKIIAYNQPEK